MSFQSYVAEAASHDAASGGLIEALGIDWRLLAIQIVAFLLLVALLGKFVYPWLMKAIDERQKNIDDARNASEKARKEAQNSKLEVEELLEKARKEAAVIVTTAKEEAEDIVARSEEKARTVAEAISQSARQELAHDVEAARLQLREEAVELVARATEKVIGKVHTASADSALVKQAVEESA